MISGLVTAWDGGDRGGAGQSAFFELEVGVDVNLGGGNTLVAESEGDDGDVDVGVQKSHGGGVPQRVATWPGESAGDYCGSDTPSSTARSRTA